MRLSSEEAPAGQLGRRASIPDIAGADEKCYLIFISIICIRSLTAGTVSDSECSRRKVDHLGFGDVLEVVLDEGPVSKILLDIVLPVLGRLELDNENMCDTVLDTPSRQLFIEKCGHRRTKHPTHLHSLGAVVLASDERLDVRLLRHRVDAVVLEGTHLVKHLRLPQLLGWDMMGAELKAYRLHCLSRDIGLGLKHDNVCDWCHCDQITFSFFSGRLRRLRISSRVGARIVLRKTRSSGSSSSG